MDKAPDAYRTISEVAEDLDLPQHVLRFWETRFAQIKPLKRGGGRRYYRPDDIELLKGIRHLLYKEGYTIKGVQRILKEQGVKAVQAFVREALSREPLPPPPPPPAPRMEIYVSSPSSQPPHAFSESSTPLSHGPEAGLADDPDDDERDDGERITADHAEAAPDLTAMPLHGEDPALLSSAPLDMPVVRPPIGQVSMFRGGLQRESEPQSAPLSEFAAQIRERVEGAPSVGHAPMPGGRDALLMALEELVACRQTIDQILARRQS